MNEEKVLDVGVVVISADRYESLVMQKNELMHAMRKLWTYQDEVYELKEKMAVYEEFFQDSWYKHCFDEFLEKKENEEKEKENGCTKQTEVCLDCQSR